MSSVATQRVIVRMLFDAGFAARVAADPTEALAGEDLRDDEVAAIASVDPRAWGVDPERPSRALAALIEEFPVACAAARRRTPTVRLLAFFESPNFHGAVRERGVLATAFGRWLVERLGPRGPLADLAALEAGLSAARRGGGIAAAPQDHLLAPPQQIVVDVGAGTLDAWQRALAALRRHRDGPARAAVDPRVDVPLPHARRSVREWLLVTGAGLDGEATVGEIPEELGLLLRASSQPRPRGAILAQLAELGAPADEAPGILADLLADGLLVASPACP